VVGAAPPQWLAEIDASFQAYAQGWARYIDELYGIWETWVDAECSRVAPSLLGELGRARIAYNAQRGLLVAALEKDRAKLDSIRSIVDSADYY
jgi:hypothetical protein